MAIQQGALDAGSLIGQQEAETGSSSANPTRNGRGITERLKSLAKRQSRTDDPFDDAGAARILAGINIVAACETTAEWSDVVARALPPMTGIPISVVLFRDQPQGSFESQAIFANKSAKKSQVELIALCDKLAIAAASRRASNAWSADEMPSGKWKSGLAVPILSRGHILGIACLINTRIDRIHYEQIQSAERFLGLAARFLISIRSRGDTPLPSNRLDRELLQAGRLDETPLRPRIDLNGLSLDPMTDRSIVGEVAVSLSRSEFDILYTLAQSPETAVPTDSLAGNSRSLSSLDVAMHRLRRKLSRAPMGGNMVKTVRGNGYMLVPPPN